MFRTERSSEPRSRLWSLIYGIAIFAYSFATLSTIYLTFTSPPKYFGGGELRETQTNKHFFLNHQTAYCATLFRLPIKLAEAWEFHASRFRVRLRHQPPPDHHEDPFVSP